MERGKSGGARSWEARWETKEGRKRWCRRPHQTLVGNGSSVTVSSVTVRRGRFVGFRTCDLFCKFVEFTTGVIQRLCCVRLLASGSDKRVDT